MRQPASQSNAVNYVSSNFPVVAPIGGWNVISSIANMPESDAHYIDNMWPTPTQVELRKGWIEYANVPVDNPDSQAHDIRTLLSYNPTSGNSKLFAVDQTGFYDVTAGGNISSPVTTCTNGSWRAVNVSTAGGSFLVACNGVDKMKLYDGTTWTNLDGVSSPPLTGITSQDAINLCLFKSRIFMIIKNSLDFAYMGVNSISGAVSKFPLGAIFRRGGYLVELDTWSMDAGDGIDDYIIFWTSEGEVAVYSGINPASADEWSLVGVYYVGAPLSYNSTVKVGGELLLLSKQGIYPLSKALKSSTSDATVAISYKIQPAFDFYIANGEDFFGWQILFHPESTMLLVNVPFKRDDERNFLYSYQFVMNTTNNSWARFTNMASECWASHEGKLYFAKHHKVYKALTGNKDGNANVIGKTKQAYNTLRSRGNNKHVKMLKPIIQSTNIVGLALALDVDFATDAPLAQQTGFAQAISLWDDAIWDQAVWTGSLIDAEWRTVDNNVGMWFSLNVRLESNDGDISWIATQYMTETGGYL